MKQIDEAELNGYLETWMSRKYGRLLQTPYFRGTITGTTWGQVGSGQGFNVQIRRTGEVAPDGNLYPCATPGYYPVVGDDVECFWRDPKVGYVAFPMFSGGRTVSRMYRAAAISPTTGSVAIPMDTVDYDPMGIASTSQGGFVAKYPGYYSIRARASYGNATSMRFFVSIYVNGGEQRRGHDGTSTGPQGGSAAGTIKLSVGDLAQLGVYTGAAVSLEPGWATTFLEVEWVP